MLLTLPLQISALWVADHEQVIGQDLLFENIPWFNREKDVLENPNTPFLTRSVVPRPFSFDNALYLAKGLHLHWQVPALLKTIDRDGVLPQAPNRWYIRKESATVIQEWIVESDYVWDMDDPALDKLATCSFPRPGTGGTAELYEFVYVGRKYLLSDWVKQQHRPEQYLRDFTAMGWGSLSFDLHYANSRSIFGLLDAMHDGTASTYTLAGWYQEQDRDFARLHFAKQAAGLQSHIAQLRSSGRHPAFDFDALLQQLSRLVIPDANVVKTYIDQNDRYDAAAFRQFLRTHPAQVYDWTIDDRYLAEEAAAAVATIVIGQYIFRPEAVAPPPAGEAEITLGVGNTLPEALSALLLSKYRHDPVALLTREEQMEAVLNLDALDSQQLDWVARLRKKRHEDQFQVKTGTTSWILRPTGKDQAPVTGTSAEGATEAVVSPELQEALDTLNRQQPKLDLARNRLHSAIEKLYLEWCAYAGSLFREHADQPDALSLDEIRRYLEDARLPRVRKTEQEVKALEQEVSVCKRLVLNRLLAEHPDNRLELALRDNTRYYEPLPPGLVVSGPDANTLLNIFSPGEQKVAYRVSPATVPFGADRRQLATQVALLGAVVLRPGDATPPAFLHQGANQWRTYRVEWELLFLPNKKGYYLEDSERRFRTDFITDTYTLDEQEADLRGYDEQPHIAYHPAANLYYGTAFINQTVKSFVLDKINTHLSNRKDSPGQEDLNHTLAEFTAQLAGIRLFELTLNNFNNSMVQRSDVLSLLPFIPNAFATHQALALEIKQLIDQYRNNVKLLNPQANAVFNPFRNGAFTIRRLRLIDCFGRSRDVQPAAICMPAAQQVEGKKDWVRLAPRIAQAATLSIRWEDTATRIRSLQRSAKDTLAESPVLGWFVPVYLTQRLECFDAWGKHLGAFSSEGNWESSPFDYAIASEGERISRRNVYNTELRRLLLWFQARLRDQAGFMEAFTAQVNAAMEHIAPEAYHNPSLLENIASVPLAITKINLNLFTQGDALHDLAEEAFVQSVRGNQPGNTRGYTDVAIPFSIGDTTRYNDGVIGYWHYTLSANKQANMEIRELEGDLYFNNPPLAILQPGLETGRLQDSTLPAEEKPYRYRSGEQPLEAFLQELAAQYEDGLIRKHAFTRQYLVRGHYFWNRLVREGILLEVDDLSGGMQRKSKDNRSTLAVNEQLRARSALVLLHPQGSLFVKSGLLPAKELRLPYDKIKGALKAIELTLLTAPVLTPAGQLHLSLLRDKRYEWSWISLSKTHKGKPLSPENLPIKERITQNRTINLERVTLEGYDSLAALTTRLTAEELLHNIRLDATAQTGLFNAETTQAALQSAPADSARYILAKWLSLQPAVPVPEEQFREYTNRNAALFIDLQAGGAGPQWKERLIQQGLIHNIRFFRGQEIYLLRQPEVLALADRLAAGIAVESEEQATLLPWVIQQQRTLAQLTARQQLVYAPPAAKHLEEKALRSLNASLFKAAVFRYGFLETGAFYDQEEIYFLKQDKIEAYREVLALQEANGEAVADPGKLAAFRLLLSQEKAIVQIEDFSTDVTGIPPLVLREGWLSIKSTQF
jgi:hypothetical protein